VGNPDEDPTEIEELVKSHIPEELGDGLGNPDEKTTVAVTVVALAIAVTFE